MAVDTFIAYVGVYPSVEQAEADYQLVKDLHTQAGMMDAYDAAVIEKRTDGKVRITKKHETPTRVGGVLGGGVGLATGLVVALFPFAAIGGGLLAATAAGGAILGAVSGHAAAGMSRDDLLKANFEVVKAVVEQIVKYSPNALPLDRSVPFVLRAGPRTAGVVFLSHAPRPARAAFARRKSPTVSASIVTMSP